MDLPTPRELELETLLRQRDTQVAQLGDEVARLRKHLVAQPATETDPVSLPPALTSLLLPHLNNTNTVPKATASTSSAAALTQRTRLLQEENDELYQLLKQSETGKLKEEVRGLRRLVERLEGALRESHQVVFSLSTELDKSYEAILTTAPRATNDKSHSRSPRNAYHVPVSAGNGNGAASKLPPTGPRAHKKPRLSAADSSRTSPPPALKPHHANSNSTSNSTSSSSRPPRDESPRQAPEHRGGKANSSHPHARMDVDEPKPRPRSPVERDKDLRHRDRERREERERDRDAARERDRDGGRRDRRNGNSGGGRGGGGARRADRGPPSSNSNNTHQGQGGDRTLKERLGL